MRDIAVSLVFFVILLWTLKSPFVGVLGWTWLSVMSPHRLAYGFAAAMPWGMVMAPLTLISWSLSKERKAVPTSAGTWLLLLFALWIVTTSSFAVFPDVAWDKGGQTLRILLMIILTMSVVNTPERLHLFVLVVAGSIAFYGVKGGVFSILTGGASRIYGPPGTFIGENNQLALGLNMAVPLIYYAAQTAQQRMARLAWLGALALTAISILFTYSRGGVLTLVLCGALLAWRTKRRKLVIALIVIGAVALPAGLQFQEHLPEKWRERMATIGEYDQQASAMQRFHGWRFAWSYATEHPVVGGGIGVFRLNRYSGETYASRSSTYHEAHSIYFSVVAEQGFVGLVLFLALWVVTLLNSRYIVKMGRRDPELQRMVILGHALQISIIAYLVAGALLSMAYYDLPYDILAISIIARALVAKAAKLPRQAELPSAEPPSEVPRRALAPMAGR